MIDGSMIDCEWVMRHLSDYIDGEQTVEQRRQIHSHLQVCDHCAPRAEFAERLKEQIRKVGTATVPVELEKRVHSVLSALADP